MASNRFYVEVAHAVCQFDHASLGICFHDRSRIMARNDAKVPRRCYRFNTKDMKFIEEIFVTNGVLIWDHCCDDRH